MPGSAISVIRDGRVAEMRFSGRTCHIGPVIDDQTVWEAASLSKPVVARYVLELASAGLLDLDEALDVDLAALGAAPDRRWREVTARRVLTHTSGLPNWRGPIESARAAGAAIGLSPEVLAFTRVPGSFGYSGEGFEVLLQALCRRAGQPAGELLDQVLARFGMRASSFRWRPAFADTAAIPHDADGRSLTKQRPGQARAAGSLHTTLADYSAFALMVLNEGADDIFEPAVVLDDSHGRSLGWGTVRTDAGIVAWQHGDNQGFKHLVGLRRARGDGIVIFTNGDDGRVLCRAAFRKVLGAQSW